MRTCGDCDLVGANAGALPDEESVPDLHLEGPSLDVDPLAVQSTREVRRADGAVITADQRRRKRPRLAGDDDVRTRACRKTAGRCRLRSEDMRAGPH